MAPDTLGWIAWMLGTARQAACVHLLLCLLIHSAHPISDFMENSFLHCERGIPRGACETGHAESLSYFRIGWNPDVDDLYRFGISSHDSFSAAAQDRAGIHAPRERAEAVARRRARSAGIPGRILPVGLSGVRNSVLRAPRGGPGAGGRARLI